MIPCWFICKKAGFSPWLSLLCLVPAMGTLVLLYILAFADWKVTPVVPPAWSPQPPIRPSRRTRRKALMSRARLVGCFPDGQVLVRGVI